MNISSEETLVIETIRLFSADVLAPRAAEIDETGTFAGCHLPQLAELGVMGLNLPEHWGSAGVSAGTLFECVAALAGACASTASIVTAHYLATDAILLGGSKALQERYLPGAAAGNLLGAFALTEPGAGSNPIDMKCRATLKNGVYHLRGNKQFISNAAVADFIVVFAVTDPNAGHKGISAFIVDRDSAGFSAGPAEPTMGLKGGHVFPLTFDCQLDPGQRIGGEGSGFTTAMKVLDNGRLEVAAMCVGIAAAALKLATAWMQQREIGGKPLGQFQGLRWSLADMATQLEAARQLALYATSRRQAGTSFSQQSAMAKLFASEAAAKICDAALQIYGGYGYSRDLPLERMVRDIRIMRIYEGSSEIQRNIIAGNLLRQ